jgi:dolichol kinase
MEDYHIQLMLTILIASIPICFGLFMSLFSSPSKDLQQSNHLNYVRRIFHMITGSGIITIILFMEDRTAKKGMTFLGIMYLVVIHLVRKRSKWFNQRYLHYFRFILRPTEVDHLPSAFWYLLGCFLVQFDDSVNSIIFSLIILSYGDPAASIIGIKIGGWRISRYKTLSGSLGCMVVSTIMW